MQSTRDNFAEDAALPQFSPDGLNENLINALLAEVDEELQHAAEPTSALLNGSAAQRRRRRIERRAVGAVVRALPVHRPGQTPNGQEAA